MAVPSSLMIFFILTGGCVLPKNCARSTSCCQAFTGTAGQYYYHAAFGFHESCQIKTLYCHVSVRVYFRKLCESDFGFWGFRILGDFAGGCESGRSSTFLEPRSPPGSFSNSPRVSSCKVNISGMVIFFDEANCSRFDIQMFNRGEQHELSFVGSIVQVRNIPIIK